MSQIPRSQFALKKHRQHMEVPPPAAPLAVLDLEQQNGKAAKKNGNSNGHKNGSFDNDVLIIDEDIFANVEEVVATLEEPRQQFEELSPGKKKRSRKSKDSTESRESDVSKKTTEKSPDKPSKTSKKAQAEQITTPEPAGVEITAAAEAKELKVIKMISDEEARSRRSNRLQNASTIVNLSTISTSEQSKMLNDETMDSIVPERRVSGRRSTRPIDDIKFEYRSPNADDSLNGTTNATIGSEFNDSLLNTPAGDRKRALNDSSENIDSPKRSRLDLSGLFSSFSTPVAMLRNKFKRANIASTPIAGAALLDESVETIAPEEMKEVELTENLETVAEGNNDEEELHVVTTPIKKRSCVVM